ncbi:hypothetical protein [Mycoplasma sp. P36-A1]|uniref:hypothetical protein n=1 Tax=Mycoplasma sp. P36-A1 TaxID=3252900 RepID=UPI003C2B6C19
MKKKVTALLTIAFIAILSVTYLTTKNKESDKSLKNDVERKYVYEFDVENSYVYDGTPKTLYKKADLVVIGTIKNEENTEVAEDGNIATNYDIKIEEVVKGKYKKQDIVLNNAGGEVQLDEYLNEAGDSIKNKSFYKEPTSEELKQYVKVTSEDDAMIKNNERRLFFISYDKKLKKYYILNNSAGALLSTANGKARSGDLDKFININEDTVKVAVSDLK